MRVPVLALCAAILLGAAGPADPVVAQCGGVSLTTGDVRAMVQQATPEVRDRLRQNPQALAELVRARLLREVLLKQAEAAKWDQKPDVAARAAEARDAVIADSYLASLTAPDQSYPSGADIQAAYDANRARFLKVRQYHLAQIFIALPASAPHQADDDAQKKLRDLRAQALKPHADFADVGRRASQDRAAAMKSSDLGWVAEDQLVPGIKEVVAGLAENAISDPIRLKDGWHLVKLYQTKPAEVAPLTEVRPAIVQALRQQRAAQAAQAYLAALQQKTPVQIDEIGLGHALQP